MDMSLPFDMPSLWDVPLLWDVLCYAFNPRIIVTHLIAGCLLFSLLRQNTEVKQVLKIAIKQEFIVLVLWYFVPYGLGTVAAIWYCVHLYEDALGVRINVHSNVQLVSDFDFGDYFRELADGIKYDEVVDEENSSFSAVPNQFRVNSSSLKIAELAGQPGGLQGGVFKLSDVSSVTGELDSSIKRSLQRINVDPNRCLRASTSQDQSAILIAESRDARDQWLVVLRHIVGDATEDVAKEWLELILNQNDPNVQLGLEDALNVFGKIGRHVDLKYIAEVFKAVSKGSNGKASNGKITFDQFLVFFRQIAISQDIELIFSRLLDKRSNETSLRPASFQKFVLADQKEQASKEQVQNWITQNEPVLRFFNLSSAGLANYLMHEDHIIFKREHKTIYQDMTQPLSHYFIATSHNTYLTKDQLKSKSSVDAYISVFKRGCKCVELDCWDGPNNEPIIYHGHTLTSKIFFRDVIRAIKDYAFIVSDFPVILSFENHCTVEQQKVMAVHLTTILGDRLYTQPMPDNEDRLPSPNDLKGYVIVKAKKLKPGVDETQEEDDDFSDDDCTEADLVALNADKIKDDDAISITSEDFTDEDDIPAPEELKHHRNSKLKGLWHSVENLRTKSGKEKVPKIAQELSDLVVYCQATHFKGFEHCRNNSNYYEMSSFGEAKALKFAKMDTIALLQYNQRQLSRIYPAGARIDSSNYNPVILWNVGCQLVALNYQTACREMQLNQGLFRNNGGCGYVLKPEFMRNENATFDPRGPFTNCQTMTIRILSGHQLPYKTDKSVKSERQYQVYIRVTGVDCDIQSLRTKPLKNNGYNPMWDEVLVFKIHVPELAFVTFEVCTRAVVGQYTLPFLSIQQGYRRVPLTDKHSVLLPNAYLLVRTDITSL